MNYLNNNKNFKFFKLHFKFMRGSKFFVSGHVFRTIFREEGSSNIFYSNKMYLKIYLLAMYVIK